MRAEAGPGIKALASAVIMRALLDVAGHVETYHTGGSNRPHVRKRHIRDDAEGWLTSRRDHADRSWWADIAGVSDSDIRRALGALPR